MAAGVFGAATARAADQIQFAPPGAWVTPLPAPVAPAAANDTLAARVLLSDAQDYFGPDGDEYYLHTVIRLQTPQGLGLGGTVSVVWDPANDVMVVHHLHIIRGDKVIDVLAAGQTFTVLRRESRLELAMLDGMLTGVIQPEGLQVGDIIDLAVTRKHRDPVLRGFSDHVAGITGPADRLRLREVWPDAKPMRIRATEGLAKPAVSHAGGVTAAVVDMSAVETPQPPAHAPGRFSALGQLEVSQFRAWSDISALMAPLYQKAAVIAPGSALRAEADKIAAASADPKARAEMALRLVQNQVRYVFLGINDGGYVPASAESTWGRRYGDCKGKTSLLLALLADLGVQAEPALVSTNLGDGLDERLPLVDVFDHVLVRATIGGKVYWLDGTRSGDRSLDAVAAPDFGWALPVRAAGAGLERLVVTPVATPGAETRLRIDASAGVAAPAPARIDMLFRRDEAEQMRLILDNLPKDQAETYLRNYWSKQFSWLTVKSVGWRYDEAGGEEHITADGDAVLNWDDGGAGRLRVIGSRFIDTFDSKRDPGPHQDAPYKIPYPYYSRYLTTLTLPAGGTGFKLDGKDYARTVGGVEVKRTTTIAGGVLTMDSTERSIVPEISVTEAIKAEAAFKALQGSVYVQAPPAMASTPTTAEGFARRGEGFMEARDYAKAFADFDRAVKMKPDNAHFLMARGRSLTESRQFDRAQADFDQALALEPTLSQIHNAIAILRLRQERLDDAVAEFAKAIAMSPEDGSAYMGRAESNFALRKFKEAAADYARSLELRPGVYEAWRKLAYAHAYLHDADHAMADLDQMAKTADADDAPQTERGFVLLTLGRKDEALKAFDAAIKDKPSAQAYLGRAQAYPAGQHAQALADLAEALKVEPNNDAVLYVRIDLNEQARDFAAAMADAETLARRHPDSASALNNRCWARGLAGQKLAEALADCDAALKINPRSAAILDSRGFVRLRLGQLDQSIADYDAALAIRPDQPASLFGRGVAKLRKGMAPEGRADLAAAAAKDPKVAEEFAGYGVTP